MRSIFLLIRQYRVFLLFVGLEIMCFWLIIQNNIYQNATFFNSANQYTGTLLSWSNGVSAYFNLKKVNNELAQENARLHKQLRNKGDFEKVEKLDSKGITNKFEYILAQVVNNSTHRGNNYITLDKGKLEGITPGMSVIAPNGVVGRVKSCSNHYSTVISVLHSKMSVSAQLKKNSELGFLKWDGKSPLYAKVIDLPDAAIKKAKIGDTLITSGYGSTFPPRTMIGTIAKVSSNGEITVKLSTNFNSLSYVYVIRDILKIEQDSLEKENLEEINE